jgi:DNA-directed RNA polymerase specialized sigma24 family protein
MTNAHRQFEAALPTITAAARFAFRKHRPQEREEAVAEAQAAAWSAWHGLLRRGKDPVAVGVCGIANYCVRYVRNGRRIGNRHRGRSAMDVWNPRAQKKSGHALLQLGPGGKVDQGGEREAWRDWIIDDNRTTPADQAIFRLDFATWLGGLPPKKRRVAELLAEGHGTGEVAKLQGISAGAVSQARTWLHVSWRSFQAQATPS